MKKILPILLLLLMPLSSQAAVVAIYGSTLYRSDIARFLEANGHTVVYQNQAAPGSAALSGVDVVIGTRNIAGNEAVSDFVYQGGLLITEWTASDWVVGTAKLIDATYTGRVDFPMDSTITLSDAALKYGMGDGGLGSAFHDGVRTRVIWGLSDLGADVEVLATIPGGAPAIIGGVTGDGYTLVNSMNWSDSFGNGNNATGQWLLNVVNNHEKYTNQRGTVPEPALPLLLGIGLTALWANRRRQTASH